MFFPNFAVSQNFLDTYYVNDNLIHAALLPNIPRVGHGFAINNNDLLQAIYRKKDISLEICPMSNEALKYYDVYNHPIQNLLKNGMKLSISPDDPGFFGYEGVSFDWFKLFMETDLTAKDYFILVKNSIEKASDIMFNEDGQNAKELKLEKIAESAKNISKFFEQLDCGNISAEESKLLKDINKEERKEKAEIIKERLSKKVMQNSVYYQDRDDSRNKHLDEETSVYEESQFVKLLKKIIKK